MRDDETAMRADLERMQKRTRDIPPMVLSVRADWSPAQMRERSQELRVSDPEDDSVCAEARFAALHGDLATAAARLTDCREFGPVTFFSFILVAAVARAYELAGDDAEALRIIEESDCGPVPMVWRIGYWHRIRYERARLLRKVGRVPEAEGIEASLRRELQLADPAHHPGQAQPERPQALQHLLIPASSPSSGPSTPDAIAGDLLLPSMAPAAGSRFSLFCISASAWPALAIFLPAC